MGLEGFPDYWAYLPGASDSARYKALSNSVAIPCVDFVLRGIALTFTESSELSERSFNMEPMKNLCGLIPESRHKRLMENKDPEMTNGEYLTKVLTAYLDQPATPRQEQRTLAVQISEEMFQQLKSYLDAHSPLTQKAFVQSLLNQALGQWEQGEEPLQDAAIQDNKKERTLAITMPETLFQRVEQYLEAHKGMSKRAFVVGVVAQELRSWEMEQNQSETQERDEAQSQEPDPEQDEQGFGMSMTM